MEALTPSPFVDVGHEVIEGVDKFGCPLPVQDAISRLATVCFRVVIVLALDVSLVYAASAKLPCAGFAFITLGRAKNKEAAKNRNSGTAKNDALVITAVVNRGVESVLQSVLSLLNTANTAESLRAM